MNHYSRLTVTLLATALVTGCASQATLRIYSEPQGAYISDHSGRLLGTAPVDVSYALHGNSASCIETDGFSAHWVSGVEEEIRPLVLCEAGYTSTLIYRDFSQPGLAADREFAVQIEMLELQQEQTRAAQDAAQAAWATAAAVRDAAYAARWSGRAGYRQNRDFDREFDSNYRDNNRARGDRYNSGESEDRFTGNARDLERGDENYRDPDFSTANRPDRTGNRVDQEGSNTQRPQGPSVGRTEDNQASTRETSRSVVLQPEQAYADQAAAEQLAADATADEARLIAQQEEQVRVEQAAAEAEAAQAGLLAQQEEQLRAEQAAAEQFSAEAAAEAARLIAQQDEQASATATAAAEQARLLTQQEEQIRAAQAATEAAQAAEAERTRAEHEAQEEQARIEQVARELAKLAAAQAEKSSEELKENGKE